MAAVVLSAVSACPPEICGIGSVVGGIASQSVAGTFSALFLQLAASMATGAAWLVNQSVSLLRGSTTVDIEAGWFVDRETAMLRVALTLILPLVLVATVGAIVRQDTRRLIRIYAVGIPVAVIGGVMAVTLAQGTLDVVNEMCSLITAKGAYAPFSHIDGDVSGGGTPLVVEMIITSVIVAAALMLWLELVLRSIVIYLAVFFLPLGLVAVVWPATTHVAKRFAELLVAIIGSKFVIVATLTLGAAMIEQPKVGVDDAVKAAGVVLLAAFAPMSLLRLVPLVEVAAIAELEGLSRRGAHGASAAASTALSGGRNAASLLLGGSGPGAVDAGSVGATDIPARAGDIVIGAALPAGPSTGGQGSSPEPSGTATSAVGAEPGHSWSASSDPTGRGAASRPGDAGDPSAPGPAELIGPIPTLHQPPPGPPPSGTNDA